ncbi:hypothetical protein VNI00_009787 [Paramarasmius palmivorus]|uniref:Uncharacterized protein n=1 Tax=Paramarasmius palmivorus TaxID=297713 RepID=A0AAW0CKZ1_9AGAR
MQLEVEDLRNLRRCDRRLGDALKPVLFASVRMDITSSLLLEHFAKKPFSFGPSVLNLAITMPPHFTSNLVKDGPRALQILEDALGKLSNVRAMRWNLNGTEDQPTIHAILSYMSNLSSLREWHLTGYTDLKFPFPFDYRPIRTLSVLSITGPFGRIGRPLLHLIDANPALTSLTLDVAWSDSNQEAFSFENLPDMQRLEYLRLPRWKISAQTMPMPSLTALDLTHTVAVTGLWAALQDQGIQLRNLTTSILDRDLLGYLESYAGIQNLALVDLGSSYDADALTEALYERVVSLHGESLVSLTVESGIVASEEWCLAKGNVKAFGKCHVLEYLSVSVNFSELRDGITDAILSTAPPSLRSLNLTRCGILAHMSSAVAPISYLHAISTIARLLDPTIECSGTVVLGAEYVYQLGRRVDKDGFVFRGYKRHYLERDWLGH